MFGTRSLVYLIEEGIRVLMDIEDVDSHILHLGPQSPYEDPTTGYQRAKLMHQRAHLVVRLAESLDLDNPDADLP